MGFTRGTDISTVLGRVTKYLRKHASQHRLFLFHILSTGGHLLHVDNNSMWVLAGEDGVKQ